MSIRPLMRRATRFAALAGMLGCAAVNAPLNIPRATPNPPLVEAGQHGSDEIWVGLAFSGGGMRASAFGAGMLEGLRDATATPDDPDGILSDVRLVTGVSGGSVTAAWFGLNGAAGLDSYRARYLVRDAERYMANSPFNPLTLLRGLWGGANDQTTFARFLDETLFQEATFGDLGRRSTVTTWLNASDVANNTAFLFSPETFDALCSDLASYRLSHAVAASAAYPLVFSPIVLKAHHGACDYAEPDWLTAARHNPEATSAMRAHAAALESYSDPDKVKFVKLLDGGITDNFGTTGLSVARARAQDPHSPLSDREAVRLKRMLFLVANAGVAREYAWTQRETGPGGIQLAGSIARSAMGAATRTGYDVMRLQLSNSERALVTYRCALPRAEVARLRGTLDGWNCADVKLFVGEVSSDALPDEMQTALNAVPTRLGLTVEQVDLALDAGRLATRANPDLNGFLRATGQTGISGTAGPARLIIPERQ